MLIFFLKLSSFRKLTDDYLRTFPSVPSLTTLRDSQLGGAGHGNSPDDKTKCNLEIQSQRKKKKRLLGNAFSMRRQETNYKKTP